MDVMLNYSLNVDVCMYICIYLFNHFDICSNIYVVLFKIIINLFLILIYLSHTFK